MHKDAAAATFFARIFYGLMHAFILLIAFTYENDLKSSCDTSSYTCYSFLSLKLLSILLFFAISRKQSIVEFSTEYPAASWERPPQFYCEICKITAGYRTRHCNKCEKCIALYDHHCFWVGCCVGELNRFRFAVYLFFESCGVWWVFLSSFSGLIEGSEGYGAFVVAIALTCVFGMLLSSLCVFHFYLISSGSTTWEVLSRYKINYFAPYPKNVNPFNEGCCTNWGKAACGKEMEEWDLPQPLYMYPFNWCDNEYWSCC